MTTYHIEPERATLHGHFSRDLPPVLTVAPGDTVVFRTLEAGWAVEPATTPVGWDGYWPRRLEGRDPKRDGGHALCGPVAVRGAEPGMTLSVRFDQIVPDTWGWTLAGGWDSRENCALGVHDHQASLLWAIDPEAMTARNQHGHRVALRPFMGVAGNAPGEPGVHGTGPPRSVGGNMDCKELVAGTTLYLPVAVPGALFSTGDGHAAQGDGEAGGTAIECPMARVEITFGLLPDLRLTTPRAETPAGLVTLGFHRDLDEATQSALGAMVDWIAERHALTRSDALALASVACDLRVTQIVNGVKGVHAVLPHGAIQ